MHAGEKHKGFNRGVLASIGYKLPYLYPIGKWTTLLKNRPKTLSKQGKTQKFLNRGMKFQWGNNRGIYTPLTLPGGLAA